MEKNTKEIGMKKVWLNALKKFGLIFLCLLFAFCFVTVSIFFISPKVASQMFGAMNLKAAERTCLEEVYNREKSAENLYNLIVFEMKNGTDESELLHINMLVNLEDYEAFCKNADLSGLAATKDKKLIAYNANINNFLLNQKVKCLYNLGISNPTITKFVRKNLEKSTSPETSFLTYIQFLLSDKNMNAESKKQLISSLISNNNLESVKTALDAKIESLTQQVQTADDANSRIVLQHCLMGNCRAKYLALNYVFGSDDPATKQAYEKYSDALSFYNSLC